MLIAPAKLWQQVAVSTFFSRGCSRATTRGHSRATTCGQPSGKKVEFLAALWASAVKVGRRLKENLLLGFWLKRFGATLDFAFWISFDL